MNHKHSWEITAIHFYFLRVWSLSVENLTNVFSWNYSETDLAGNTIQTLMQEVQEGGNQQIKAANNPTK